MDTYEPNKKSHKENSNSENNSISSQSNSKMFDIQTNQNDKNEKYDLKNVVEYYEENFKENNGRNLAKKSSNGFDNNSDKKIYRMVRDNDPPTVRKKILPTILYYI